MTIYIETFKVNQTRNGELLNTFVKVVYDYFSFAKIITAPFGKCSLKPI